MLKGLQKILQGHLAVPLPSPIFSSFSYFCIAAAARGPLRALGSKTPGPALQRRRYPSLRALPRPPACAWASGACSPRTPGVPVAPGAVRNKKTTTPSRLRSDTLQLLPPGDSGPPRMPPLDFKFQEALRVRFPGSPQSRAAPRVPRSGIPFSDYTLLSGKSLSGTTRSRMQQGWGRRGWVGWRGAFQSLGFGSLPPEPRWPWLCPG